MKAKCKQLLQLGHQCLLSFSIFFSCFLCPERAQLYQQYNELAQNLEILTQSGSHVHRLPEYSSQSPTAVPPPASRPLPPLPSVLHPHSLFHNSFSSVKSLPLPEPPRNEGRPPSPRLSVSFTQSPTLWQDLPGVRNSSELGELTEHQRRLQEVTHRCQTLYLCFEYEMLSSVLAIHFLMHVFPFYCT